MKNQFVHQKKFQRYVMLNGIKTYDLYSTYLYSGVLEICLDEYIKKIENFETRYPSLKLTQVKDEK